MYSAAVSYSYATDVFTDTCTCECGEGHNSEAEALKRVVRCAELAAGVAAIHNHIPRSTHTANIYILFRFARRLLRPAA